jgi:glycosyltransferase involved in cell wall biosynthesis
LNTKQLKIFFLKGGQEQPNTASYNRFLMLQQMTALHFDAKVVGFAPNLNRKIRGNKWINGLRYRLNILKGALMVPRSNRKQTNIIFLLSTEPLIFLLVWITARFKGNKIINERNEFPETIRQGIRWRVWIYKTTVLWWQYRLLDGLLLMTDELIHFYSPHTSKKCVIQKLPMTVDFNRFDIKTTENGEEYMFYAGSLSEKKDGIERLIRAFSKVSQEYPNLSLKIAGAGSSLRTNELIQLINSLGIVSKVQLLGEVQRTQMPDLLVNAKILTLPRPDSIQARGGFPTKLGEYLATGKPIIATRVGEIPNYLTEKELFFISPQHIERELAEKTFQILENYEKSLEIAKTAKAKAFQYFSTEANAKNLKKLILKIS